MGSDSDSDSSIYSSGTAAFGSFSTIPPSPNPSDPQYERGPLGEQFLVFDYTANLRAGAKASGIWHHGGERRRTDNNRWDRYWRCGHCTKKKLLKIGSTVRLLGTAILQQQEPLLYTMES
jgi:hypothetical protein